MKVPILISVCVTVLAVGCGDKDEDSGTTEVSCSGEGIDGSALYATHCASCHGDTDWGETNFAHDPHFPVPHQGVEACEACHTRAWTPERTSCVDCALYCCSKRCKTLQSGSNPLQNDAKTTKIDLKTRRNTWKSRKMDVGTIKIAIPRRLHRENALKYCETLRIRSKTVQKQLKSR